ncbi:MAG: FtsW/RodA/SpoVE family cell cycle protein [Eubacteriales bacterium]
MGGLDFVELYNAILRFAFPALAMVVLWRCGKSLLGFQKEPELWAWLVLPSGDRMAVTHWENLIGRHKSCDLRLEYPTISRNHAVLTRYDDGSWTVSDVGSKGGVEVNGKDVSLKAVEYGDVISLGGVACTLVKLSKSEEQEQATTRTRAGRMFSPAMTLLYVTLFEILTSLQFLLTAEADNIPTLLMAFGGLMALQWVLFWSLRAMGRTGFEVETLAFFLTNMGLAVVASSAPSELEKQLISIALGVVLFLLVGWSLRNLERAKKVRYIAAVGSILLLAFNLVFGTEQYGATNWIYIGGMSFQPSELVKVCFVFVGASTLDRLLAKRNLILFIIYSALICGCLGLMNDFGTALIFFVAFLIVAYLRSGDFASLSLICAGVGFGGFMLLRFKPYAMARFASWGNVWADALDGGFQQTRSMMCIASGGLFGLGAGRGWLKYVAAADTDLVFAFIAEEWGLILSCILVVTILFFAVFVAKSAPVARSSFYTIGATTAAGIFVMQVMLNVFGTVDLLPLTGVTFPFVSNGGSSMLASWGLLAFIKAADTRRGGSFAVGSPE